METTQYEALETEAIGLRGPGRNRGELHQRDARDRPLRLYGGELAGAGVTDIVGGVRTGLGEGGFLTRLYPNAGPSPTWASRRAARILDPPVGGRLPEANYAHRVAVCVVRHARG